MALLTFRRMRCACDVCGTVQAVRAELTVVRLRTWKDRWYDTDRVLLYANCFWIFFFVFLFVEILFIYIACCVVFENIINLLLWPSIFAVTYYLLTLLIRRYNRFAVLERFKSVRNRPPSHAYVCLKRLYELGRPFPCVQISRNIETKDLGTFIDSSLSFRQQYSYVIDKAYQQLGFIHRLTSDLNDPFCLK